MHSSANRWHLVPGSRTDGRSLIKSRKSKGHRTVPCGTPEVTLAVVEWQPSTMTLCVRSPRKALVHFKVGPCIPYSRSLFSSLPWGTSSKGLLKSNTTMSVWCPSSLMVRRSCTVVNNCVSQEKDARKPCCSRERILCLLRWAPMWLHMMCSSTLHVTQVRLTGR